MNRRSTVTWIAVVAMLGIGCNARTRYAVLSFFFDGVPPPPTEAEAGLAAPGTVPSRRVKHGEHGPYAAKLCAACHASAAANTFVAPRDQLCFACHELPREERYVHGPLASGGCTACHDPHSSPYRYLLVSESDRFCFYCHAPQAIANIAAHGGDSEQCTTCHDPHMSDKPYLLR